MRPLFVGIVGCGSAGPAAALFLHRAGHRTMVFERISKLEPVGAGFLIQPTGLDVLADLGLLDAISEAGGVVTRLYCRTRKGRTLIDLPYEELAPGLRGVGMHRATLLHHLVGEVHREKIPVRMDTSIVSCKRVAAGTLLIDDEGAEHGPFDLVVVADGARSALRTRIAPAYEAEPYDWGALWFVGVDEDNRFAGQLYQVVEGARRMVGFLPTGTLVDDPRPLVSFFYSVEMSQESAIRAAGLNALKDEVLSFVPRADSVLDQIHSFDQLTFAGYHDVVMRVWHSGNIVFIGDAAHATSPQLGQGVNLALQDARVLSECIAEAHDVQHALAAYSRARRHQLRYYQFSSRWLTPFFQSRSRFLGFLRDVTFPIANKIGPLRRQMTRTMSGVKRGVFRRSLPIPKLALPPATGLRI